MTILRLFLSLLLVLVYAFATGTSFAVGVPPVAMDDDAMTDEDVPIYIDILANDTDPDGDPLTISSVTSPFNGAVDCSSGQCFYRPNPDYWGSDSFQYTIEDPSGNSDTATVYISVNPVNDPPNAADDFATTDEDTPVTIDVLANDSDVDGGALTIFSITSPTFGTAVVNADGTVTYTPNTNYSGDDLFIYQVEDGNGGTDSGRVDITVNPVNNPPDCTAASPSHMLLWPPSDEFVDIQVLGVTDPDGDTLTITINGIYQDEPVSGKGSGQTTPDGMLSSTDTDMAAIRAERNGNGDGRVYHIVFDADDGSGGACTGDVMVSVPRDQSGAPAVDGGALYDSTGTP